MNISIPLAITLVLAQTWTIAFSMTNRFPLRGNRNIGLLGCYISPVIFVFTSGFKNVAVTWLAFALLGAIIYTAWDIFQNTRANNLDEKRKIGLGSFTSAPFAWPIMIPEAIEYFLSEIGVLKSEKVDSGSPEAEQDAPSDGDKHPV